MIIGGVALGGCNSSTSSSAKPGVTPSVSNANLLVFDCQTADYKPEKFTVACGDGNLRVQNMTWTSWAPTGAIGTGQVVQNTCTPSCVAGTFTTTAATISLRNPVAYTDKQVFSSMTATYSDGQSMSFDLVTSPL